MRADTPTRVTFSHLKYGRPLAVDASSFAHWTGIVPDGEPHVLDFHEFLVVADGQAKVVIGDRAVRIDGPGVCFTPPRVVRRVEVIQPLALQLVVFSDRAVRTAWAPALRGMRVTSFSVHDRHSLLALSAAAHSMAVELSAPQSDSAVMLDALLAQFMVTLNRSRGLIAPAAPSLLIRFEHLLESRFRSQHDVAHYAAALGITADHLSSVIRSRHAVSAKAMIDRRVFIEAARLLTSTGRSIADIGLSLGFDEPSHFTRAFKRACGQSPSDFREQR